MHIAVALCSYQGERFLGEQLASIAAQTRPPDSVVIVDDASTDATVEIARAFASVSPFDVEVHVNARTLGYAKNFERAIGLATGDVIVLADQDDVWYADKLARIEAAFAAPEVGLVFSDADVVDARLEPLGFRLWQSVGLDAPRLARIRGGDAFGVLAAGNCVTGATLAFRSRYRELVLPIAPGCDHDAWIALLVAAVARVVPIEAPSIAYRQHGANQIGAARPGLAQRIARARRDRLSGLQQRHELLSAALARLSAQGSADDSLSLSLLRSAVLHLGVRAGLPAARAARLGPVLRELATGHYHHHSEGIRSAVRDLLI